MVTVIIPVYNAEPYLRRCLDSVLASVYREFELILVNDGSTDGSLEICREYAVGDSRIRLISQQNAGVSAARNRGLDICRGEWVTFVDADDAVSANFLGLIASGELNSQDLLLFDFTDTETELARTCAAPKALCFGTEDVPELLRRLLLQRQLVEGGRLNFASPGGKAYRKSLIDRFHIRFEPCLFYGEDKLFNAEYLVKAERCAYIPAPVYYYAIRPDSASHRFHPELPRNLAELLERLRATLEAGHMFALLERDFYSYALDNLSYSMVWTVFSPQNPQTGQERLAACRALRENRLYCRAMSFNRSCGHIIRRTLILLFRLRWYFAAGALARLWRHCLLWKKRR